MARASIVETNLHFLSLTERQSTTRIIIHHTGRDDGQDTDSSAEDIHEYHLSQEMSGIGYHFVVRKNGTIERGRPETVQGAHAKYNNEDSIGIHLSGTFTSTVKPTDAQIESTANLIADLCERYHIPTDRAHILGHKDVNSDTGCPGESLYAAIGGELLQKIQSKAQVSGSTDTNVNIPNTKKTITFMGQTVTFEPVLNWRDYCTGSYDDGEDAINNLTSHTILGLSGTLGLLEALGVHTFVTSAWRSPETNAKYNGDPESRHMTGEAIDLNDEPAPEDFWYQFVQELNNGGYWQYSCYHDAGSGMHLHMQVYSGGLTNESPELLAALQSKNGGAGAKNGGSNGRGSLFGGGNTPMEHSFQTKALGKEHFITYLIPQGKTFCEPVYPDLIYLTGSIPSSVVGSAQTEQLGQGVGGKQTGNVATPQAPGSSPNSTPANVTPTQTTANGQKTNDNIERMVQWAMAIANDQSHGYSQGAENATPGRPYTGTREGPDYDCSSFVYHALEAGGFPVRAKGYSGRADTIWDDLSALGGWTKYSWDNISNYLQRGDILCNPDRHAAIYLGNDQTVEAAGVNSGDGDYATGDQGNEIDFYNAQGRSFTEVYRFVGSKQENQKENSNATAGK